MEENNVNVEPNLNDQDQKKKGHKKVFFIVIIASLVAITAIGAVYYLLDKKKREDGLPIEIIDEEPTNEQQAYYLIVAFADTDKNITSEKIKVSKEEYEDAQITAFNEARDRNMSFVGVYKCKNSNCATKQQVKKSIYEINDNESTVYFDFAEQEEINISDIDFFDDDLLTLECEENKVVVNEDLNKKIGSKVDILNKATNILIQDRIYYLFNILLKTTKINDLDNQDKLWFMYFYTKDAMEFEDTTSDKFLEIMKSIFGSTFDIEFENMYDGLKEYDEIMYKYDKTSKTYKYVGSGHGVSVYLLYNIKPVKFEEKNGKYYISYKLLLSNDDVGPYNDYADADFKDLYVSKSDKCESISKDDFAKIESQLKTVTFVFEQEDDNLVLTEFIK